MVLSWKKKKRFNPSQSRKANSGKGGLLYPGNPSWGSPGGNISRLRRAGFVPITVLSLGMTSKAKSPAALGGGRGSFVTRLFSTVAKQMRSCHAALEAVSVVCCPRLWSPAEDSLGTLGSLGGLGGRAGGLTCMLEVLPGSVWFFCLRVCGWVFPPGLPCRQAGGRTSGKFQEAESRAWAWQSCGKPGRCSSVPSP